MELDQFKSEVLPVRSKIYSYSLKILNDLHEAEDTVQEVLLKLWLIRHKLPEYRNIEALSIEITKNICLNKLNYQKRRRSDTLEHTHFISNGDNIEKRMDEADAVSLVKKIIEQLPGLQRMVIQMRDVEGYELQEIADVAGCNIEAVRMNLSRARKKVKEVFFKINNVS